MKITVKNDGVWRLWFNWFGSLVPGVRYYFSARNFWMVLSVGPYNIHVWR